MKKTLLVSAATLMVSLPTFAGDYLTNTNQHAAFLRMVARGASIDIDGVLSNPAGLAFLPKDGFYLSLTGQSAFQTRNISATTPLWTQDGQNTTRLYEGKASAPIIPSFHAAYKKDNWTLSTSFAITAGGGKASFDSGLPMFDAAAMGLITQLSQGALTPSMYDINSSMEGRQYIYGLQLGLTYKVNGWLSVYAGGRMNYFSGGYKGFLNIGLKEGAMEQAGATLVAKYTQLGIEQLTNQLVQAGLPQETAQQQALQHKAEIMQQAAQQVQAAAPAMQQKLENAKIELDCDQSGWGLTPIIGVDAKFGPLNIGARYEFVTNMNIENKTNKLECPAEAEAVMAPYAHGVNTPSDIPAMLSVGAQYAILPSLRVSAEYHFFDDKNAGMAEVTLPDGTTTGKQNTLKRGTNEFLGGIEWDVDQRLTVSCGMQRTSYGVSDNFQTDTSFYCSSYSYGFGARVHLNEQLNMDIAYFWTNYGKYQKDSDHYYGLANIKGSNVYDRTNKVFGLSLNYQF